MVTDGYRRQPMAIGYLSDLGDIGIILAPVIFLDVPSTCKFLRAL